MAKLIVHFVRHGLTKGNMAGRFIGWTDILLAPQGREELKNLKDQFEYPKVDRVFSSPLVRARETADILFPDHDPVLIPGLKEVYFGKLEEVETGEVLKQIDMDKWLAHDMDCIFPEGESILEARFRVLGAMTRVIQNCLTYDYHEVAVIAHGAILRTIMEASLVTTEDMRNFMITPNGMGVTVEVDTEEWFKTQKFLFIKYLPEGARRPDPEEFPFYKIIKAAEEK